jgi:DNA-binding GntR family transcriptional regulator
VSTQRLNQVKKSPVVLKRSPGAQVTSAQIFNVLAQRISNSELAPGQPLREQPLSLEFGVSRTPLREALMRLEQAGLIERHAPRGFVVRSVGLARIDQIFSLRIVLEEFAVSLAADAVDTPEFQQLIDAARDACEQGDYVGDPQLREEFHERLAELSGNEELVRVLEDLDLRIYGFRRLDWQVPERARAAQREHLQILELLRDGDVDGAQKAIRDHISVSGSVVRSLMEKGLTSISFAGSDRSTTSS